MDDSTQVVPPVISSHRDLHAAMQAEVGATTPISLVHPHPHLARMVCLWAGHRRKTPRKNYKALLLKQKMVNGLALRNERQDKWKGMSAEAAAGLDGLAWKRIRRIVGLNPWGEQLLLRVKVHAISVYNPVSAGPDCPHADCSTYGRVDLFHVFWECLAAKALRAILLKCWRAAGLRLENYEAEIFGLRLPGLPQRLTMATGLV